MAARLLTTLAPASSAQLVVRLTVAFVDGTEGLGVKEIVSLLFGEPEGVDQFVVTARLQYDFVHPQVLTIGRFTRVAKVRKLVVVTFGLLFGSVLCVDQDASS